MKIKILSSLVVLCALAFVSMPLASQAGQGNQRNTKTGNKALQSNTTGSDNTADGDQALFSNTVGNQSTAVGSQALFNNATASDALGNEAVGFQALYSNTTGQGNHAFGLQALFSNIDGIRNLAAGGSALFNLSTGDSNTAVGNAVLINSDAVNFSSGLGRRALFRSQGDQNTGLGFFAGSNLTNGTNNIFVGSVGPDSIGSESNTIRIGTQTATIATIGNPPIESHPFPAHTATFIAGIFGATTAGGIPVYVDGNGRLGTIPSSRRFKDDIEPMDKASEAILSLRPVTFRYKTDIDSKSIPQFGLVAEEVAKVNSDLVVRDGKGDIYSVRYEAVNAMLLNEFIKQHRQVVAQQKQIDKLAGQLKAQAALIQKVSARVEVQEHSSQLAKNQ